MVMIQPYQSAVDADGETALIFIGGRFSHAMRKGAVLSGPASDADHRFDDDGGLHITPCNASRTELELAEQVLDSVSGRPQRLLYARVDLVPGDDRHPLLMELELIERQLFFRKAPGSLMPWRQPWPHESETGIRWTLSRREASVMRKPSGLGPATHAWTASTAAISVSTPVGSS